MFFSKTSFIVWQRQKLKYKSIKVQICFHWNRRIPKSSIVTWALKRKLAESMECTDAWFIQQGHLVSDPLKVRHTLDCIAADLTVWTCIYIFTYNTGNKIVICQLKKCKIESSKVLLSLCTAKKQNTNLAHLYIQLETFALILNSKIIFKNFFFFGWSYRY